MNEWISVNDRLPGMGVQVLGVELFYNCGPEYKIVSREHNDMSRVGWDWRGPEMDSESADYWMPLPPAPEVET